MPLNEVSQTCLLRDEFGQMRNWVGDLTQAIEHMLGKCKALSSKPSPAKKKQKVRVYATRGFQPIF
jgi:hypothetical protein